jgi:DNA end-binding protein Ku
VPLESANVKEAELKLAFQLIEQSMVDDFKPEKYEDEVKTRIQEVVQKKVEGEEVAFAPGEAPKAQIIDLMEALKASLDTPGGGRAARDEGEKPARKPAKAAVRKKAKKAPAPKTAKRASR